MEEPNRGARQTDPLAGGGEMGALMRSIDWSSDRRRPGRRRGRRACAPRSASCSRPASPCTSPGAPSSPSSTTTATGRSSARPSIRPPWGAAPGDLRRDLGHHRPDVPRRDGRAPPRRWSTSCCRSTATASSRSAISSSRTAPSARRAATSAAFSSPSPRRPSACSAPAASRRCRSSPPGRRRRATAEAACAAAADVLAENPADLPFALLYLLDPDGKRARLAGAAGLEPEAAACPSWIELAAEDSPWPLAAVLDPARRGSPRSSPPGPVPCRRAGSRCSPSRSRARIGRPACWSPDQPAARLRRELPQLPRAGRRRRSPPPSPTPARWPRPRPAPRRWRRSIAPRRRSSATSATSSARR